MFCEDDPAFCETFFDTLAQKLEFEHIRIIMNIDYFDIPARSAIPFHSVTNDILTQFAGLVS
jgi:hypothetical protein